MARARNPPQVQPQISESQNLKYLGHELQVQKQRSAIRHWDHPHSWISSHQISFESKDSRDSMPIYYSSQAAIQTLSSTRFQGLFTLFSRHPPQHLCIHTHEIGIRPRHMILRIESVEDKFAHEVSRLTWEIGHKIVMKWECQQEYHGIPLCSRDVKLKIKNVRSNQQMPIFLPDLHQT